MILNSWLAV